VKKKKEEGTDSFHFIVVVVVVVVAPEWAMPRVPTGSADVDSPVSHGASYTQTGENSGLHLATNAMRTTNTLDINRNVHRSRYEEWIEDQLGLHDKSRSRRKPRRKLSQKTKQKAAGAALANQQRHVQQQETKTKDGT